MSWISDFLSDPTGRLRRKLADKFSGREKLNDEEYVAAFFQDTKLSPEIVKECRRILINQLGEEYILLYPDDDWTKEFSFIGEFDSLWTVELSLALEENSGISFSESEAVQMKSLRRIIEIVDAKKNGQSLPV